MENASIFHHILSQKMGNGSVSIKPCVRHDATVLTSSFVALVSNAFLLHTIMLYFERMEVRSTR